MSKLWGVMDLDRIVLLFVDRGDAIDFACEKRDPDVSVVPFLTDDPYKYRVVCPCDSWDVCDHCVI